MPPVDGVIALAANAAPFGQLHLSSGMGLLLAAFLVFLNGFFVAAEFALVKVRPTQIDAHTHTRRGGIARHMLGHLDAYLSATQLGITLASLGLGWVGEPTMTHLMEPLFALLPSSNEALKHTISITLAFALISTLHIVLGELAPKSLAIRKPEATSLWVAVPLFVFYKISFPAIWLLNHMANAILKLVGIQPVTEGELAHGEEEIRRILASDVESSLPEHKRELLDNIFELSERVARQVMVPRADVVYLDVSKNVEENLETARRSGHTRFLLCDGNLDRVLGLIHIKDLFRSTEPIARLEDFRRDTVFVPETFPLERVMRRLRGTHIHMAAVIDEYGGVAGIVTLENVIEEIVGEIQDEFDSDKPELVKLEDDVYEVSGSMLIADLEAELDVKVDPRDEDTVGGIVLSDMGRVPRKGDRVRLGPLQMEVLLVERNRVRTVRVQVERAGSGQDSATASK